jgi:uncharacterized DUF497 family protein
MRFEWDEAKNRANLRKHGFHLADAVEMFGNPILVRPDIRADYGEERLLGIGMTKGRVAFVAFAQDSQDRIRIISLRKANREEREEYEEAIQFGLESS